MAGTLYAKRIESRKAKASQQRHDRSRLKRLHAASSERYG